MHDLKARESAIAWLLGGIYVVTFVVVAIIAPWAVISFVLVAAGAGDYTPILLLADGAAIACVALWATGSRRR